MKRKPEKQSIAVVGAGIAGLSAAWLLSQRYAVTLYEAAGYLGGHTHTVDVTVDGQTHPVDTGFLVFNARTYPNLCALFAALDVASVESEMSFSVSLRSPGLDLEWAGSSLATVFGQKRNLVRPAFWRMLADILRFNRESVAWLATRADDSTTLRDYLTREGYSGAFADWYLLPMAAAIWSCPPGRMLDYPLATFVRFCRNHGLLQVFDRPRWRTVAGGGRVYVEKLARIIAGNGGKVLTQTPVRHLERCAEGILLTHADGIAWHDRVVLACHSDQALKLLGGAATERERDILGRLRYQMNRAVLHTDPALLPRKRSLWSAWNYLSESPPAAADRRQDVAAQRPVAVSYLINRLQPLPFATPVLVTLNPQRKPTPAHVIAEFEYAHPVFDGPAIAAQGELDAIDGRDRIHYCGAWGGYGFHEDGLKSGLRVANALGCFAPWQRVGGARADRLAAALEAA